MKHVAVIGAKGYVGNKLYQTLAKDNLLSVEAVTRENYSQWKQHQFDIIINAAMPAARFWAKSHPEKDFIETVQKTADIIYGWHYQKVIHISTISARTERDTVYGRHKAAAETLCNFGNNFIVRLTATFGDTLKKGSLIDLITEEKVYVNQKSKYSFAHLDFVCQWIADNLDETGIQEVGAKNSISLEEIAKLLNLSIHSEGRMDHQEVQKPLPEFPDAKEVVAFLQNKITKRHA